MTKQEHISDRKNSSQTTSVDEQWCIPCPKKIAQRIRANLRHTAQDRWNPERAQRARELLQQIEPRPAGADLPEQIQQPMASIPPMATSESTAPVSSTSRWYRLRSTVQQSLKAVAQQARIFRLWGRR